MRTVARNNSEVAHMWANQIQEEMWGSHYFFKKTRIYSYGSHYISGQIVTNKRGERGYILNNDYYSSSTATHNRKTEMAIPTGSLIFYTQDCNTDFLLSVIDWCNKIMDLTTAHVSARVTDYTGEIDRTIQTIKNWMNFWGYSKTAVYKKITEQLKVVKYKKHEQYESAKKVFKILFCKCEEENVIVALVGKEKFDKNLERRTRYAEGEASRNAHRKWLENYKGEHQQEWNEADRIAKWHNGKTVALHNLPFALLRYRPMKKVVETSKGITVSLDEATRLWHLFQIFHSERTFQHDLVLDINNHQWKVNSYENDVLTAGCHRITYKEAETCAKKIGLI